VTAAVRLLHVLGAIELLTLGGLLGNLALVQDDALAAGLGPVHGIAYVAVVITALLLPAAGGRARLLALVPGIGGLLVARSVRR